MSKDKHQKTCFNCKERHNCDFILTEYGYCCYCILPDGIALIFNLHVYKEFRKMGHAKEIIEMCIRKIRKNGYKKEITIQAEPQENSISVEDLVTFYRKMGLTVL